VYLSGHGRDGEFVHNIRRNNMNNTEVQFSKLEEGATITFTLNETEESY